MDSAETRKQAIAWWGVVSDFYKFDFAALHLSGRAWDSLTGREIEEVWKKSGYPSAAMEFAKLKPEELIGRIVFVQHDNDGSPRIRSIAATTKTCFRLNGGDTLFKLKNGCERTSDPWHYLQCTLTTQEAAHEQIRIAKEMNASKNLRESITRRLKNATFKQLEAANKALGG